MLFGRESEHFTLAGMLPSADHVCDCLAEAIFAKLQKRRRVGVAVSMQQLNTQDERIAISDLAILLVLGRPIKCPISHIIRLQA